MSPDRLQDICFAKAKHAYMKSTKGAISDLFPRHDSCNTASKNVVSKCLWEREILIAEGAQKWHIISEICLTGRISSVVNPPQVLTGTLFFEFCMACDRPLRSAGIESTPTKVARCGYLDFCITRATLWSRKWIPGEAPSQEGHIIASRSVSLLELGTS